MKRLGSFSRVSLCLTLVLSCSSLASGVITISGKLTSITESEYVVESAKSLYYINKKSVSPIDSAKLTRTEIQVSVTVPFEGVDRVRSKPKS